MKSSDTQLTNLIIADEYARSIRSGPAREYLAAVLGLSWAVVDAAISGQLLTLTTREAIAAECLSHGVIADHNQTVAQIHAEEFLDA